ncbi:uncharacterized protein LOC107684959 [Sinocyclocheilus anshuiensis]|uniref:uncharacterized protein LOC107684959 n=1 Tax=Sinocyclocheilus anshuiensis TaxID=1608454 RepID=UPI0007B8F581|nr:PREDICTED: uncharacterized protein LOC107684959 [Sinocyclocheilus anshuiensis]
MTNLSEEIKGIIHKTLPNLSEETQLQIISKLQSSGLESKEDLRYVQKEDIADLLPVIQLRKLMDAFKQETETITLDLQVIPPSSPLSTTSSVSEASSGTPSHCSSSHLPSTEILSRQTRNSDPSNSSSTSQTIKTWPETFQVPWEKMPQEIRSAIVDRKRPKPMERRQMVRVLVDEMRRYEANPTRSQCLSVIRNIIRQYPKSFADMGADGSLLGGGYTSLLIQVKNHIENVNREANFTRHRASRSSSKRGPSDSYDCTRFQPDLPPEETDETLEQSCQKLVEIYSQEGAGGAERAEVKNRMEHTFCLQRRDINALPPPDVEDLRSKWPFLFTRKFIYAHFELLTDITVLRSLELSMEECGTAITQYFTQKPINQDIKDVLSKSEDDEMALRVVQLLMAHFGEKLTGLVLFTDQVF